jgi:hypothetical protein
MHGLNQTRHYRLPPMPWGIDRDEISPTLKTWHPNLSDVALLDYRAPRGAHRFATGMIDNLPVLRHEVPSLVKIRIG